MAETRNRRLAAACVTHVPLKTLPAAAPPPSLCPQDPPTRDAIQAALKTFDADGNGSLSEPVSRARLAVCGQCHWQWQRSAEGIGNGSLSEPVRRDGTGQAPLF